MDKLRDMPNIGKVIENLLIASGVFTPEDLYKIGSRDAFLKIRKEAEPTACLNMLYSLEGAVKGVRYSALTSGEKNELKLFYNSLS